MRACVVEDDPDLRELVRDALEGAGWTVDVAEDGFAALANIHRVVPDLILLDLVMPNLGGVEVLKLIRSTETGQRIPVIVMTGETVRDSVGGLASAVLTKPFEMHELLHAVRAHVAPRS